MKKIIIVLIIGVIITNLLKAQNIAITDDNSYTADGSAMLDVKSITKGFLIPRMTTVQRNSIASPATGLLVYDTNENVFYYYTGTIWSNLSYGQLWSKNGAYVYLSNTDDNVGIGVTDPNNKLLVKADASTGIDESIFAVLNTNGDTVFAVYNEGVRIWVDDNGGTKANGSRGGFAVGGYSPSKSGFTNEYLRVTPDSVRIYIDDDYVSAKANGSRGGFAVGGFSPSKGATTDNYLFVQDDSTRVYTGDTISGFGVENIGTGSSISYMHLSPYNYFIGHQAGDAISTGLFNSFFGYQCGLNNADGNYNVFTGYKSGYSNVGGSFNTFMGYNSGMNNTSSDNTFIGFEAGESHLSGGGNVYIGSKAGKVAPNGSQNVFIGENCGYSNNGGSQNIFIGFSSGYSNTTGLFNVFIGNESGLSNTTGSLNTAVGYQTLYSNSTGGQNTAFGYMAEHSNLTGTNNAAFGRYSLYMNSNGWCNTATGSEALMNNTSGAWNTSTGAAALTANTTGWGNTAIGGISMQSNLTGNMNTSVGYSAYSSGTNFSNSTAIGSNTDITASNQVRLGSNTVLSIGGYASWTNISDSRFKKDISETVPGLDFILKLRPVTYHLDFDNMAKFLNIPDSVRQKESEIIKENMLQTGFIAQEVEQAAKALNFEFSGVDKPKNENDIYGLRYAEFTVPLVKSVQELNAKNDELVHEINILKNEIEILKSRLDSSSKK